MLEQLRWQLSLWFVGLSILLYIALSISVILIVDSGLTRLLDDELRVVTREVRPTIDYSGQEPSLRTWANQAKALDIELLATVQLYDESGKLIESHGPVGVNTLLPEHSQFKDARTNNIVRTRSVQLDSPGKGYLQIVLSTRGKDVAMQQLIETILLLAPFLVAALGVSGYVFAGRALKPTEESLGVLRRFVADAGHEFTTPVAVISASVETLERRMTDNKADMEVLAVIGRATERMANLARDLVYLAKMERPSTLSPLTRVNVDELVNSVIDEFSPLAREKGVALVSKDMQKAPVIGHADSLRTMISNLIKNGVAYTESGGSVSISLERIGSQIQITFEDTGIGIPAECLPKIFDRFYRVDKSRSRAGGGSGLGLAIVKAIVDGHGGTIQVENVAVAGTKFRVTLPVRAHLSPDPFS
jgi:signal transduction histidine kinase